MTRQNNREADGRWIGFFIVGDRVIPSDMNNTKTYPVGVVTHCFGHCTNFFGYAYIVTWAKDCYGHFAEWQLELETP